LDLKGRKWQEAVEDCIMRSFITIARMGGRRRTYNIWIGKPGRNRPFGRPRRRWGSNIRIDLREIGWEGMDWIHLAQDGGQWRVF